MTWSKTVPGSTKASALPALLTARFTDIENGDVLGAKKLRMAVQASDPSNEANYGFLFTKDVDSKAELFYLDEDGNAIQLTDAGTTYGNVVQVVSASDTTLATCSTAIPLDSSTPQNTEGNEVLTLAITPKNTANILTIEFFAPLVSVSNASGTAIAALFQDATADALAAGRMPTGSRGQLLLSHRMAAGTTSSTTFKVRVGASSGFTAYVNGSTSGAAELGSKGTYVLKITESLP